MAAVGSENMIFVKGPFSGKRERLQDITRAGTDGNAFRREGLKSEAFTITTKVDALDFAAAETLRDTYDGMVDSIVSIVDDRGITHANMLIRNVRILGIHQPILIIGGINAGAVIVDATWTVQQL